MTLSVYAIPDDYKELFGQYGEIIAYWDDLQIKLEIPPDIPKIDQIGIVADLDPDTDQFEFKLVDLATYLPNPDDPDPGPWPDPVIPDEPGPGPFPPPDPYADASLVLDFNAFSLAFYEMGTDLQGFDFG